MSIISNLKLNRKKTQPSHTQTTTSAALTETISKEIGPDYEKRVRANVGERERERVVVQTRKSVDTHTCGGRDGVGAADERLAVV